jgi:hypothetical protein
MIPTDYKCVNQHDLCYQGTVCDYCEDAYDIRLVGDIHGNFGSYKRIIGDAENVVQVGDYGMGFVPNEVTDIRYRFIRGNHDNPAVCREQPNYIEDGTVEYVGDETIMYIGGAASIDRAYRTEGVSWWPDEECSYSEFLHFFDEYMRVKPTIMITHECPEEVSNVLCRVNNMTKLPDKSLTRRAFQNMWENHKPKLWCFGHWHSSFDMSLLDTRFICLNVNEFIDIKI